jgi:DNA polymerase-3 subunit beta
MKLVVMQNDLNKALGIVGRVVPNRGQLPVLANVLLEADKEGMKIAATNLEIGLRVSIGGKTSEDGQITVPARNFSEFVASLPSGNVVLESENEKLKVQGGKLSATFTGIAASEFPVMPKIENIGSGSKLLKLKKQQILRMASHVAMAAASDESRPVLTGVLFTFGDGKTLVTATDGFRLSRQAITDIEMKGLEKGLIVPSRTITEMAKIVSEGKKEEVVLGIASESNQIVMEYDSVEMMSRILEGNFPDVNKIIPTDFKTELTADKEDLLRAVKAAGIFAKDSANVVRFKIQDGLMVVSSSSSQTGESETEVEIDKKGDDSQIAFNYRYVLEFLNNIEGERILFKMNESLTPGVFEIEGDLGLIHLIMPVRI